MNWTTLEAACELVVDCPHSTPVWTESGVLVFRSHNVRNGRLDLSQRSFTTEAEYARRVARAVPTPGDLIITREAPMGEVAMIPEGVRGCLGQRMVLLRPNARRMDGRFLLYALMSPAVQHEIGTHDGTGSTVSNLRIPALKALRIPCPTLAVQRAVAQILGALDDKIELNRRMNKTLEEMARALFKSWFVDFDPVRAKSEGRAPSGMHTDTAQLFPSELVDSELGPIPKGWSVRSIGDLATIVGGSTPSTKEPTFWDNGEHFWATPKDLSPLETPAVRATERKITDSGLSQIGSGLLPPGTVLLSSRAPIGYLGIAEVPLAINQGFIAMKPNDGIPSLLLLRWAEAAHDEIVSRANGSTFLEISKANFRPIPLVTAPTSVFRAFEAVASPLYRRVVLNENETTSLSRLRDGLLPRLLSGEVSVGDAEDVGKEKT